METTLAWLRKRGLQIQFRIQIALETMCYTCIIKRIYFHGWNTTFSHCISIVSPADSPFYSNPWLKGNKNPEKRNFFRQKQRRTERYQNCSLHSIRTERKYTSIGKKPHAWKPVRKPYRIWLTVDGDFGVISLKPAFHMSGKFQTIGHFTVSRLSQILPTRNRRYSRSSGMDGDKSGESGGFLFSQRVPDFCDGQRSFPTNENSNFCTEGDVGDGFRSLPIP